jgi:hypothetical protein
MRKLTKISLLALAAALIAGSTDAAFAARKKHRTVHHDAAISDTDQRKRDFDRSLGLEYDANGVPILIKGYSSVPKGSASQPAVTDQDQAREQIRQSKFQGKLQDYPRPYGSGYVPSSLVPPNVGLVPQQAPSQQITQPYNPPKLNTFSDRVTSCIHSFPLQGGIGNNPRDQQSYIRQCANN